MWKKSKYFYVPIRGWAISPEMGPASHTSDVNCSDNPRDNKNRVPYLRGVASKQSAFSHERNTHPSSTVHATCAPAIDILYKSWSKQNAE